MIINIKSSNFELTEGIRNYFDSRLKGVKKFLPERKSAALLDVELNRVTKHHTGDVFRAEINIRIDGRIFHAESTCPDLYEAIDRLKDEITRELGSFKDKKLSLLRRGGQKIKNLMRSLSSDKT